MAFDDNVCEVMLEGDTYYIPCDRVRDLSYIDDQLVNVSSSSLTFKKTFSIETTYPYIRCDAMSPCRLYNNYNQYSVVEDNYYPISEQLKITNHDSLISILLIILIGVKLLWKR